jgi:hypothetical protein
MRKSLIAISTGLFLVASGPQAYTSQAFGGPGGSKHLTETQKCQAACENAFDKCVKKQRQATFPDVEVCKLKRKTCMARCTPGWR